MDIKINYEVSKRSKILRNSANKAKEFDTNLLTTRDGVLFTNLKNGKKMGY